MTGPFAQPRPANPTYYWEAETMSRFNRAIGAKALAVMAGVLLLTGCSVGPKGRELGGVELANLRCSKREGVRQVATSRDGKVTAATCNNGEVVSTDWGWYKQDNGDITDRHGNKRDL